MFIYSSLNVSSFLYNIMVIKMKKIFLIGVLISSIVFGCKSDESINNPSDDNSDSLKVEGYNLVWNDEFNVDGKPDETKWGYDIWDPGKVNNELQYYTSDSVNVRVKNGKLEIESHYYSSPEDQYTSARVVS